MILTFLLTNLDIDDFIVGEEIKNYFHAFWSIESRLIVEKDIN
jgi:hypothetical protein